MKKSLFNLALTLLFVVAYPAFSQVVASSTQSPSLSPEKTPNSSLLTPNSGVASTPYPTPIVSPAPQLDSALKKAMIQIDKDVKSGKLTKAQAASLKTQVLTIRKQELADLKSNGKRELTSGQETQLSQQLSQIETSL